MNAVALFSVNMCSLSALPGCRSHMSKERAEWVTGPDRERPLPLCTIASTICVVVSRGGGLYVALVFQPGATTV